MDSFLLLSDIKTRIQNGLSGWPFRQTGRFDEARENYITPSVLIGQLPPRKGSRPTANAVEEVIDVDEPFILIRPIDGALSGDAPADYELNIAVVCGIYSHESRELYERGVHDVMNLCDRLLHLLGKRHFWADNRFKRTRELKWTIGAPRAFGPYEAGLQEQGPIFSMVIEVPFERVIYLQEDPIITSCQGGIAQAGTV